MLRIVIVDDEPLARSRLRRLLAGRPDVEVVGEAGDGVSACRLIETERPDLVLLDIQMPGLSGFDVLRRLTWRPRVVFVTAYDRFAVQAFEAEALDYLLKPVEPERLARAVERAVPGDDDRLARLLDAVARLQPARERLAARQGNRIVLVDPAAVCFVRAEDKYSVVYTGEHEHVLDRTLDELERSLGPESFLRIHRSLLVNVACVRELRTLDDGRCTVLLDDARGTTLQASRRGAALLRARLRI
jgi:DNA-binding LytR/AlgR family response regulator